MRSGCKGWWRSSSGAGWRPLGLEEGLALARRIGYPMGEARLLHTYGCLHRQKGAPGLARERLGARKEVELAAWVLTTLG